MLPLMLIGVGTVALLAKLDVLPAEVLREAASMGWPLVLIAVGVAALFGRRPRCGAHREARAHVVDASAPSVPDTVSK